MELRVGNKYRLGRKIGSGSFGDIYLGTTINTGEEVIIFFVFWLEMLFLSFNYRHIITRRLMQNANYIVRCNFRRICCNKKKNIFFHCSLCEWNIILVNNRILCECLWFVMFSSVFKSTAYVRRTLLHWLIANYSPISNFIEFLLKNMIILQKETWKAWPLLFYT